MHEMVVRFKKIVKENAFIYVLLMIVGAVFVYLNSRFTDINFLALHSIDEYEFHGSLLRMYDGLSGGNIPLLFRTGFYSYGFLFFFTNFIFSAPFIHMGNTEWAIFVPRMISAAWAMISMWFLYAFSRKHLGRMAAGLLCMIIVLMPGFWFNGSIFHPDWMMAAGLAAAVYFLSSSEKNKKFYWWAVASLGVAVCAKIQAITFLPLLFLYVFETEISTFRFKNVWSNIRRFAYSLAVIFGMFVVTNVYILHPTGWGVFVRAFLDNMWSNATNHGAGGVVSFVEKIGIIGDFYVPVYILGILILSAGYVIYKQVISPTRQWGGFIASVFLLNIAYLVFFVNKAWQHYYLPVVMLGIFVFAYALVLLTQKIRLAVLVVLIVIQAVVHTSGLARIVFSHDDLYEKNKRMSDFIVQRLENEVGPSDAVLVSPSVAFQYTKLGLGYRQVKTLSGDLTDATINEEAYERFIVERYMGSDVSEFRPFVRWDYIILNVDDPYAQEDHDTFRKLLHEETEYELFAQNDEVYIFKHQ